MADLKRVHSVSSNEEDSGEKGPSCSKQNKLSGAATYKSIFKNSWTDIYPIKAVEGNPYQFFCIPCARKLSCHHQGLADVRNHCGREKHNQSLKNQPRVTSTFSSSGESQAAIKAEVLVTNLLVQHNLPIATADHLGPLFREIFPDSRIAKSYKCARTKAAAIPNEAIAPQCHKYVPDFCKTHPFSVGNDGSNDTGTDKMNPLIIKIFDVNNSETVTNHFFSMCLTEEEDCCKAYKIFEAIENAFDENSIPWYNCVSLSVDNTNAMIGRKNSIASKVIGKNEEIFISGCPCHLAHIAASHANDSFSTHLGLNVEDVFVDLFYWFDKSSKRKGKLLEYFDFCDQEYQSVLKHLSVRWLSFECCLDKVVKKLPSLRAYFLSEEDFADARFQRLNTWSLR